MEDPPIPEGEFAATVQPIIEVALRLLPHRHRGRHPHHRTRHRWRRGRDRRRGTLVTRSGYMPPWPASDAGVPMKHDFSIEPGEVATIAEWAEAGGGLDVPGHALVAEELPADSIERDIVTMPAEAYTGSGAARRLPLRDLGDPRSRG
ncbi:MAG: hypothetical protein R2716_12835 [Microthrixaceae bacterium]